MHLYLINPVWIENVGTRSLMVDIVLKVVTRVEKEALEEVGEQLLNIL